MVDDEPVLDPRQGFPRCEHTGLQRYWCSHCDSFTMTADEYALYSGRVHHITDLEQTVGRRLDAYRFTKRLDLEVRGLRPPARPPEKYPDTLNPALCEVRFGPADTGKLCGRPRRNDSWLCDQCADQWDVDLTNAAILDEDLDIALRKAARFPTAATATAERDDNPLPVNLTASKHRSQLHRALAKIARALQLPATDTIAGTAALIAAHWGRRIGRRRDAPELAGRLHNAVHAATVAVDVPPTTSYLGPCTECRRALHAPPGEVVHRCSCGHPVVVEIEISARQRRALDGNVTIKEVLEHTDIPARRLRHWIETKQLTPSIVRDPVPLYRWGAIVDLQNAALEREQKRRETQLAALAKTIPPAKNPKRRRR